MTARDGTEPRHTAVAVGRWDGAVGVVVDAFVVAPVVEAVDEAVVAPVVEAVDAFVVHPMQNAVIGAVRAALTEAAGAA
ncbi:MAG: hypothetical protein M0Z46_19850 [Actinomycetota bacterium]|nr:hypothetical protein [Actinomycetota bacterium]